MSGAEPLRLHEGPVVANNRIEILVLWDIRAGTLVGLADPARAVNEDFVKSTTARLIRLLVPQMPLPEDPAGVSGGLQDLGQGGRLQGHPFALKDGMSDSILHRMPTGHDGGTGRCAGRTDEESVEAGALVVKGIQMGSPDPRVSVSPDRPVSLVIGDHQNDVRRLGRSQLEGRYGRQDDDQEDSLTEHDRIRIPRVPPRDFIECPGSSDSPSASRKPCRPKVIDSILLILMETVVQSPDQDLPCTIREVMSALKRQKLVARHEAKGWGDWIHLEGSPTVISIESMRGLTTTATVEHAEDEPNDPRLAVFAAFHSLGWVGIDEDGEYPLG